MLKHCLVFPVFKQTVIQVPQHPDTDQIPNMCVIIWMFFIESEHTKSYSKYHYHIVNLHQRRKSCAAAYSPLLASPVYALDYGLFDIYNEVTTVWSVIT